MAEEIKRKVLVVDDEPDAVEFVQAVLEEAGYEVAGAADGEAGLEAARAQVPDLVILDVQMPGKDGFTVFAEMRKDPELAGIPVVMLTGRDSEEEIQRGREMGAVDYCIKHIVPPKEIIGKIKSILGVQD